MYAPILLLRKSNRIQYDDQFTIKMKQCKNYYVRKNVSDWKEASFIRFVSYVKSNCDEDRDKYVYDFSFNLPQFSLPT